MTVASTRDLIPLREAPDYLPKRNGKKVHYSTVYRWATKGTRGRKLETLLLGGVLCTSPAALDRFMQRDVETAQPQSADLRKALYGKPR